MCAKYSLDWNKRSVLIVTGASRGLGRCIANRFAEKLSSDCLIVLLARNRENLEETRSQILSHSPEKVVVPQVADLSELDVQNCEQMLENAQEQSSQKSAFEQAILVHNAGTLGDVSQLSAALKSASEIRKYFEINLCSTMYITSAFLSVFKGIESRFIINISSLCARKPFKGFSLYCTGKAARDMFFSVVAEEEGESVTVLNYAPGPLHTDMLDEVLGAAVPEVKEKFYDEEGKLRALTCDFSVSKLITVLESSGFKSGDHVDVFDCA